MLAHQLLVEHPGHFRSDVDVLGFQHRHTGGLRHCLGHLGASCGKATDEDVDELEQVAVGLAKSGSKVLGGDLFGVD